MELWQAVLRKLVTPVRTMLMDEKCSVLTHDRFSHDPLVGVQTELEKYTYCISDIPLNDSLGYVPEVVQWLKVYQHSSHMHGHVWCSPLGLVRVHSLGGCEDQDWIPGFCCTGYITTSLQNFR